MTTTAPANQNDVIQQEILRVAIRLYRKFGPNKVTMDDVARATGRSRTSLYYYYKNRDEIFQAVLDSLAKLKTSEDWKSVLSAMWSSMEADEKSTHTKAMDALHKKLIYQESIILNEILSSAVKQNNVRAISPGEQDMLDFIISSGIRGLRREIYDQNDPHDIKAAVRLLTDMIIKWLEH